MVVRSIALAGLVAASLTILPIKPAAAIGIYHSPNAYEDYIIQHESSGQPWARNYLGCIGLMQSCPYRGTPAGLAVACPDWEYDVPCQLKFFDRYVAVRYGSYYNAYLHERNYGWF